MNYALPSTDWASTSAQPWTGTRQLIAQFGSLASALNTPERAQELERTDRHFRSYDV